MTRELHGVLYIRETIEVEVMGMKTDLDLIWADGQIGAMPVFNSKEWALEYADGDETKVYPLKLVGEYDDN